MPQSEGASYGSYPNPLFFSWAFIAIIKMNEGILEESIFLKFFHEIVF